MNNKSEGVDIKAINKKIESESAFVDILKLEINKVIVGQNNMVERLMIGLLGQGHVLLEGVPGLAKTLAINTLSQSVKGSFSRIQFTPDLLPADILGTLIFNPKNSNFETFASLGLLEVLVGLKNFGRFWKFWKFGKFCKV